MGKVIINNRTTIDPVTCIGEFAGECWGADTSQKEKNYKRGLECLSNNHGRTLEFPQVYLVIDGYSARMMRELYTHIGGNPTRLQASTRYINYENVETVIPPTIKRNDDAEVAYMDYLSTISDTYKYLLEVCEVPKEDIANILPLGMESKMVLRTNLRQLIDMSHQRLCNRAYWEFRQFIQDLMKALSEYSEEWAYIVSKYFKPKCEVSGFCEEKYTCKRMPTKAELLQTLTELSANTEGTNLFVLNKVIKAIS